METAASILIVDDEPGIRDLLIFELSQAGQAVTAAKDGDEAVERIRAVEFDVVISDMRMPGKSGIEVLKEAKAAAPDTEVLIMTAFGDLDAALGCLRAGAFDFLAKPFNTVDLLFSVDRALERRQLRSTAALYRASQAVFAAPQPHELPRAIVEMTLGVMGCDDVSLMLPGTGSDLYVAESHTLRPEALAETQAGGNPIATLVAKGHDPVLLPDDLAKDPRLAGATLAGRVRSSIVFPLYAGERLVGVLNFSRTENPRPFRRQDVERAAVLAAQVLLALENVRLVRQMVYTDRLATIGQLAASVAHEINNPAACVISNHGLLHESLDQLARLPAFASGGQSKLLAELRESLAAAEHGAARIGDIVRDMSSLSRKDGGVRSRVDLNEVIRSALRLTAMQLRRRAKVVTQLGNDVEVMGLAGPLSQVLVNLFANAAQAMEEMGQITVTSRREGDQVLVTVADTGSGIAAEVLPRIFEAFFTTKGPGVGTGLGLSISREIVRSHGGEITVESARGKGTTFRLSFPAATPAEQPAVRRRLRILFIDDDDALLTAYERSFGEKHDVVLACDGETALRILAKDPHFDLVACDMRMPGLDGMEVFERARQAHAELERRFVFISGSLAQEDVQAFLRTVQNQALEKPYHLKSFKELVERQSAGVKNLTSGN